MSVFLLAGAIAMTTLGIVQLLRGLYRVFRKMIQVHDLIEKELQNNGGSSMKDGVEQINRRLNNIENRLERLERTSTS